MPVNPCIRAWAGFAGGKCYVMGLWLNGGLRLERQCGPHPGSSIINCKYFKAHTNYWITITRKSGVGRMEVCKILPQK